MKTDARVRYTQMRIRDAFLECLSKKPVSKITVKEICDIAEINRATFYKHYADPFDLLDKLEDEALAWLQKAIDKDKFQRGILLTILQNVSDMSNPYSALASANGDPGFAGRISELFYQEFLPQIAQILPGHTYDEQAAAYTFVVGGCSHLLTKWIKNGKTVPPVEVAKMLESMTETFIWAYNKSSQ